ncbi:sigma-70 family RNA polymerase sigma factor [Fervidibacillus albus]|uniref:Sigma-70 family RNA polymerase sigma factor n=1 Tax=Fervidibacillus albus TaxID=2980026 RepID=A0A9E8LU99_9BACI|nr:sigma-70 family RNA polymerase sigma factor [Fervidibacillus albus]WAA09758.1 sigma-70 family RNA polymerase sigma factor [Fervidibacillus albus]
MNHFEEIAKEMRPMIFSIIRGLNIYKNHEEYFQIGLIGLWKAYEAYNHEKGSFSTFAYHYIRGMILTELRKEMRKEKRELQIQDEEWKKIGGMTDTDISFHRLMMEEWMDKLPEKKRQLAHLYFYEGIGLKEIAAQFKIGYSTAKLWKREVIAFFKKEMKRE